MAHLTNITPWEVAAWVKMGRSVDIKAKKKA